MQWQTGRVVAISECTMTLRFEPLTGCQRCLSGRGCGAGVFSRLFARRGSSLTVPLIGGVQVDDAVRVGLPERALLLLAARLYGLPLVLFVLIIVAAQSLTAGQAVAEVGVLFLALLAAAGVTIWQRWRFSPLNPVVERLSAASRCRNPSLD